MMISPRMKVSEIHRLYPAALPVLAKYRIDLCCGGRHELEVVAKNHGLNLAQLLEALEKAIKVTT
jgi:iron-sulfur cluster repair protein YtfE (RIC family)